VPDGGTIIELGVAAGEFAAELLAENPAITYIGIDRWSDHHDEAEMQLAMSDLWQWRDRVGFHRMTFTEALPIFPHGYADMVYCDGYAHTGQEGGQTLEDWYPVVKPGGIFAGHDYCPEYQPTVDAVDAFCVRHGLELSIIDDGKHPSWWVRKPA
jgi:predicted O-methyltransferase YrrM